MEKAEVFGKFSGDGLLAMLSLRDLITILLGADTDRWEKMFNIHPGVECKGVLEQIDDRLMRIEKKLGLSEYTGIIDD